MRKTLGILILLALCSTLAMAVEPRRPVSTYSIVARDAQTGQLGVAVQSHWFSVGSIVTWARAGVGVVATQSFVDPAYGQRGLDLMETGLTAEKALAALVEVDEGRDVRQVAFVDVDGTVAAHTGQRCIEYASHKVGDGYSVQANMMHRDTVVEAMAEAYEGSPGDLAARLLAALRAAEGEGGDIRGRQSAAILIVKGVSTGRPWADRIVELRVEDDERPVDEIARLLQLHRAYEHMNAGDVAVEHGDLDAAGVEYSAAAALAPNSLEVLYWQAVTLATTGQLNEAIPLFRTVFAADPHWRELTARLTNPGIIPDTAEGEVILQTILSVGSE